MITFGPQYDSLGCEGGGRGTEGSERRDSPTDNHPVFSGSDYGQRQLGILKAPESERCPKRESSGGQLDSRTDRQM